MSSLFTHAFVPTVILLLFSKETGLDTRKVLGLSIFAVLPDADTFFLPHRAALHNIFILIIPFLLFIIIKNKRNVSGIVCFYLASHIVLDLFDGGIFLLYPVYNNVFFAHAEVILNSSSFVPVLDYGISREIMNMGKGEPVVSSENIGIGMLLVIVTAMSVVRDKKKRDRNR